jgi:quinoprotein glucose dehydrogenase
MISEWMDRLLDKKVEPSLQLDLLDAAALRSEDDVKAKLAKYKASIPEDEKLPKHAVSLEGGEPTKGQEVFEFSGAQCMRCHRIGTGKGGDAGPNLQGVGKRLTRDKILESLIDPSAVIVPGFAMGVFRMADGQIVTGSVMGENEKEITVKLADGKVQTLQVADVKKRLPAVSPMPTMDGVLKPREIRDLISFLMAQ